MNELLQNLRHTGGTGLSKIASFAFPETQVVYIEGGLGSQILGTLRYLYESDYGTSTRVLANLDYFETKIDRTAKSLISKWNWELDRYGHSMDDFRNYRKVSKILKWKRSSFDSWTNSETWRVARSEYTSSFLIDMEELVEFQSENNVEKDYGVLHIRRGDFVNVSARLVTHEQNLDLLKSIKKMIPNSFIIVSDELIPVEFKNEYQKAIGAQVLFLDSPSINHHLIHSSRIA